MNHYLLPNGVIASTEDEIIFPEPKAKKEYTVYDRRKRLIGYGLDIASDYIAQATKLTQETQKFISQSRDDLKKLDDDLKGAN